MTEEDKRNYELMGYHCPTCHKTPVYLGNTRDGLMIQCCSNVTGKFHGNLAPYKARKAWVEIEKQSR